VPGTHPDAVDGDRRGLGDELRELSVEQLDLAVEFGDAPCERPQGGVGRLLGLPEPARVVTQAFAQPRASALSLARGQLSAQILGSGGSPGPGLPREEGRRVLENVTLLLEPPDAFAELPELLALGAGQPVIAFSPVDGDLLGPVPEGLLRDPEALGDVTDRPPGAHQLDRLAIGPDTTAQDLARLAVERVNGDPRSVHIEPS
jgi:hypothetical protein